MLSQFFASDLSSYLKCDCSDNFFFFFFSTSVFGSKKHEYLFTFTIIDVIGDCCRREVLKNGLHMEFSVLHM